MSSIAEPTITHPTWCSPNHCDLDDVGGTVAGVLHRSAPAEFKTSHPDPRCSESISCDIVLTLGETLDGGEPCPGDGETLVDVTLGGSAALRLEDVEKFATWLLECAREYRAAITG